MERSELLDPAAPLPVLLRDLRAARRSCVVRVQNGLRRGELKFVDGELVAIQFGELRGPEAVAAVLTARELVHAIEAPAASREPDGAVAAPAAATLHYGELFPLEPEIADESLAELGATPLLSTLGSSWQSEPEPAPAVEARESEPSCAVEARECEPSRTAHTWDDELGPGADDEEVAAPSAAADASADGVDGELARRLEVVAEGAYPALDPELDEETEPGASERRSARAAQRSSFGARRPSARRNLALWVAIAACAPLLLALGSLLLRPRTERAAAAKPIAPALSEGADRGLELLEAPVVSTPPGVLIPTVLLRVRVDANGAVQGAQVQSPRPALAEIEQQAVQDAAHMRFRPALQAGRAVEAWTTVPLRFAPAARERTLQVKGSDTIGAALGPAWAEGCERSEPGLHVRVEALGSNTGFAGLLDGSAEIAASSRPVRADELGFARKLGVELREIITGYDGIAVIVHPDNPVRELDLETLARIFAQRVTRWSELSGEDAPIHAFGRPSYSGTHGFFQERVFAALGQGAGFGTSLEELESSREVVARVAADPHAIGYVSLGHVQPEVRVLALRPGPGAAAVAASAASIRDGSYPIARPLFLYLRSDAGRDARAFVDLALSPAGQGALAQHGFVPLGTPALTSLRDESPAAPAPKPELLRIYFANASASVPGDARDTLNAAAALLRTGRRALVIGNADATGDVALNRRIAERRAQAVAAALRRQGNAGAPIEIEVADSQHPLASNATAEGRSANRRVDVIVFGG